MSDQNDSPNGNGHDDGAPTLGYRRFYPGDSVVATPAALDALERNGQGFMEFLNRHVACDWGDLDEEDRRSNDEALVLGNRLLSVYELKDGTTKVWIITEADRSSTTVLLPSDY